MRLFISYARVDKPFCQQIVDTLDVHDVWYDHRISAGQKWWEEILKRLTWCDGFVYLLSKESVTSEYCKQEFTIAHQLGKQIFPVLIHPNAPLTGELKDFQYVDFSNGFDVKAVKQLLNSIHLAEREPKPPPPPIDKVASDLVKAAQPPAIDAANVIDEAAEALDAGNFDRAVYLLKTAQESGYASKFIDLTEVIKEAEAALEKQSYLRNAEREYRPIVALIKRQRTFHIGCKAFNDFRRDFPDYDPEGLAAMCLMPTVPTWVDIPAGEVIIERERKRVIYHVDTYKISKYPITNEQYQSFVDAPDGYVNDKWWSFSNEACEWHKGHPKPLESKFADKKELPRGYVCWYEATAFCLWLSVKTGHKISLPTEQQWQRAAQGNTTYRYPWGNKFDKTLCNTSESGIKATTPVGQYPQGVSPFGVYDMAGNVWEWCSTKQVTQPASTNGILPSSPPAVSYIVRGGSFLGSAERAKNTFYFKLDPVYRYFTIGFRVVMTG